MVNTDKLRLFQNYTKSGAQGHRCPKMPQNMGLHIISPWVHFQKKSNPKLHQMAKFCQFLRSPFLNIPEKT